MDSLDSRYLTDRDSFVQLFPVADEYVYHLTTAPENFLARDEASFNLTVSAGTTKKGSGEQHDVSVIWDAVLKQYMAKPAKLEIKQNDIVMWHCERSFGLPPFAVRGQGKKKSSFSSSSLGPDAAFTHFFFSPGKYVYQVNGGGSFLIDVADHRLVDPEANSDSVALPPVVSITQGQPTPQQLSIVTGQTVVWLVERDIRVRIALTSPEKQVMPK